MLDFSRVERQALARYTQDAGNHVSVEVHGGHPGASLKLLFVADVNGRPGIEAVETLLQPLREERGIDFCVVNGENAADGLGITPKIADKLLAAGADVITLGNHTWRRKEIVPYLSGTDRVIRPANYSKHAPGRGLTVGSTADGTKVAVINLLGSLYLEPMVSAYEIVDDLVEEARRETPIVIVDFHGEATSEKVAMARWLDGKVTGVFGTHTHVQTNDARSPAGWHGGDYRCGHDGAPRLRDRGRGRTRDRPHADESSPVRDRRR